MVEDSWVEAGANDVVVAAAVATAVVGNVVVAGLITICHIKRWWSLQLYRGYKGHYLNLSYKSHFYFQFF
jgi:hypothetical protein